MRRRIIVLLWLACHICSASVQAAQTLYAIDGEFDSSQPGRTSQLYRLDPETGQVLEVIGDTGEELVALTAFPGTGELYAVTSANSAHPNAVVRINPQSGQASFIGDIDLTLVGTPPIALFSVQDIDSGSGFAADKGPNGELIVTPVDAIFLAGVVTIEIGGEDEAFNNIFYFDLERAQIVEAVYDFRGRTIESTQYGFVLPFEFASTSFFLSPPAAHLGCKQEDAGPVISFPILGFFLLFLDPPISPRERELDSDGCIISADTDRFERIYAIEAASQGSPGRRLVRVSEDYLDEDTLVTTARLGSVPDFTAAIAFSQEQPSPIPALNRYGLVLLITLIGLLAAIQVRLNRRDLNENT